MADEIRTKFIFYHIEMTLNIVPNKKQQDKLSSLSLINIDVRDKCAPVCGHLSIQHKSYVQSKPLNLRNYKWLKDSQNNNENI
jgi:hypothetical protein